MPWDAVTHDGQWAEVPDDVANVIHTIQEHWPELKIMVCEDPEPGQAPFLLVEHRNGTNIPIMSVWELDHRLIEVIHQADTAKHDVSAMLTKNNLAAKLKMNQDALGWREYCKDVIVSMHRHIGTSYTFKDPREGHEGEIVKVDDDPAHRTVV